MLNRKGFYEKEERRLIREDIARRHRYAKHKDKVIRERKMNNRNYRAKVKQASRGSYVGYIKLILIVCFVIEIMASCGFKITLFTIIAFIMVHFFTKKK